jgi:hypothetical protein
MRASILDLRYHMKDILRALDRHETVEIFYHDTKKGTIIPVAISEEKSTKEHPFFGMHVSKTSVEKELNKLRGGRYDDI